MHTCYNLFKRMDRAPKIRVLSVESKRESPKLFGSLNHQVSLWTRVLTISSTCSNVDNYNEIDALLIFHFYFSLRVIYGRILSLTSLSYKFLAFSFTEFQSTIIIRNSCTDEPSTDFTQGCWRGTTKRNYYKSSSDKMTF